MSKFTSKMSTSSECSDLDHLKVNVSCPKCKEPFKEPKLLPCLHCACVSCLPIQKGVRKQEGLKYIVVCPVCREQRELPKTGLSSLPDAHFKTTMVKLYRLLDGRGGRCEECKMTDTSAINSICDKCGFICDSCVESHKKLRTYSEHKMVSVKGGAERIDLLDKLAFLQPSADTCNLTCLHHTGEPLKMYCKTCKRLVCRDCTVTQHRQPQHQSDLISNVIAGQKEDVDQTVSSIRELQVFLSSVIKEAQSSQEALEQQREVAKFTVSASLDELVKKLEQLKEKLLQSVDDEVEHELSKLANLQKRTETRSSEIDDLINVSDQSFKYCTDQEFMMLKHYMLTRLKEEARKKDAKLPSTQVSFDLPFSCLEKIKEVCSSHLDYHHSLSSEKSYISGKGRHQAEVGKLSQFVVHTLTKSSHICIEKQHIEVTIVMPRTGETLNAIVTPGIELSTYEISYEPTSKGQYEISVKVAGEEVSESPFFVSVRTSKLECSLPILVCERQEWPWGVACSTKREIYITRNFNHMVMVLDKDGHTVRSFGIKGLKAGQFWKPTGIAVDCDGSVYVADGDENGRVQKFNSQGQFEAMYLKLSYPHGVMVNRHGNRVYVCDKNHNCVVVLDNQLQFIKTFGELCHHSSTDGYESVSGHLLAPHSIAEDSNGLLYVTDMQAGMGCVHVFTADGEHCRTFTHPQAQSGAFAPLGICIEDDYVYVCDGADNCLVVFRRSGELVTSLVAMGNTGASSIPP